MKERLCGDIIQDLDWQTLLSTPNNPPFSWLLTQFFRLQFRQTACPRLRPTCSEQGNEGICVLIDIKQIRQWSSLHQIRQCQFVRWCFVCSWLLWAPLCPGSFNSSCLLSAGSTDISMSPISSYDDDNSLGWLCTRYHYSRGKAPFKIS